MAENEILIDKQPEVQIPSLIDPESSKIERSLYLFKNDRMNWLIIFLICLILVVSFHKPFQWMLNQWFVIEENSPGPIVPILLIVIFWSQFKKTAIKPSYNKKAVYIALGISLFLGAVAYLGKEYKKEYPQYEILSIIAFDILFFALTLILIYVGYLFYRERKAIIPEIPERRNDGISFGLFAIILGLLFHFMGMRGDQDRISLIAYIAVIYGLNYFLFGRWVGKRILFPYAILAFIVPMEFLDDYIGGPLRVHATNGSVWVMQKFALFINMEVIQHGTKFIIDGKPFDVAPACSGLRSLVALTIIGASYAFISQPTALRKWLLGLCAIPIALFTNIIRLVLVGLTSHFFGSERAMWVHDNAIFLYILAIIAFFSLDKVFDRLSKTKLFLAGGKWIKAKLSWLKVKDF